MKFTARAKAFSGQGLKRHPFLVEDGVVRVWDPVAGYYTLAHSLSDSAERRLIKIADEIASRSESR